MVRQVAHSDVFAAIADPTRRDILDRLGARSMTVSELAEPFGISQPAVSQHLRVLRDAGLVNQKKAGRYRLYQLEPEPLYRVFDWVAHYRRFWKGKLRTLGRYLDEQE